jgi:alcohol dehydrogenase
VVDVTAMAPSAFVQAIELAADNATVCVAGIHGDGPLPGFRPDLIVIKQLRVIGTRSTDLPEFRAAVGLLSSRRYPFDRTPRRTADLDHLPALLEILAGEAGEPPPPFAALLVDGPH